MRKCARILASRAAMSTVSKCNFSKGTVIGVTVVVVDMVVDVTVVFDVENAPFASAMSFVSPSFAENQI